MLACIITSSRPVSAELSAHLHRKAIQMVFEQKYSLQLRDKVCRGVLFTEGKFACIGTYAGLVFKAEVECDNNEVEIGFLLNSLDVDPSKANWSDTMGIEEALATMAAMEERDRLPRSRANN